MMPDEAIEHTEDGCDELRDRLHQKQQRIDRLESLYSEAMSENVRLRSLLKETT